MPSRSNAASNLPGPQARSTVRTVSLVDAEQTAQHGEVGRERDDCPDVEVTVRPAVASLSDARRERVVDVGMTEGALDADRHQPAAVEEAGEPDDAVELEQGERGGGRGEVDLAGTDRSLQRGRERRRIDLQAELERRLRERPGPMPPFAAPATVR